jgi:hypothetical protein
MPSWIVLSWALTVGWLPSSGVAIVDTNNSTAIVNQNTFSSKFEISAEAINHIRVWGSAETRESFDNSGTLGLFNPYEAYYRFGTAIYSKGIEVGIEHECAHGIEAGYTNRPWLWSGYTNIYVKVSGTTK